jgi:predicted patatin/cPLA2 family phospholipase
MIDAVALVLEGGGMRGLYTAGVLDVFLEQRREFPYCVGVAAGACNMVSFISGQYGRNRHVNIDYVNDKRYLSWRNWLFHGSIFGMDMLFDIIPNRLVPFDHTAFSKYRGSAMVGTTDCLTGKPVFFEEHDISGENGFLHLQASSSLPLLARPVEVDGYVLMDGGVSVPIPVEKARQDGFGKVVVVLTQPKGYRKNPSSSIGMIKLVYGRRYKGLVEAMEKRHLVYNQELDLLDRLESEGSAFVIRPSQSLQVGRLEKDRSKLDALYRLGMDDTNSRLDALHDFLRGD